VLGVSKADKAGFVSLVEVAKEPSDDCVVRADESFSQRNSTSVDAI
jgi:hypothetical protein